MEYDYAYVDSNNIVRVVSNTDTLIVEGCVVIKVPPVPDEPRRHVKKLINGVVDISLLPDTKEQLVSELDVTTSTGKVFDGDEKSQDRMLRAIAIANISGQTTTEWKMADNSVQTVTLEELQEALTLAGQEMSRIWMES